MRRLAIIVGVVALLGGLFAYGLLRGSPDRDIPSALVGKAAPEFALALYERYQPDYGPSLTLAGLRGTPLVVNFWASWCGPCYEEAPVLQATWERYQDRDVLFVGVQTQDRDNYDQGRAFLSQFGLSFPNGMDNDSRISVDYALYGVPETYFIDAEGRVAYKHVGPVNPALMEAQLEALLR